MNRPAGLLQSFCPVNPKVTPGQVHHEWSLDLPFDMPGPTSVTSSCSSIYNHHPRPTIGEHQRIDDWGGGESLDLSFIHRSTRSSLLRPFPRAGQPRYAPPSTLPGFGAPLSFNSYVSQRPCWLIAKAINVNMGGNAPVSLSRRAVDVRVHTNSAEV